MHFDIWCISAVVVTIYKGSLINSFSHSVGFEKKKMSEFKISYKFLSLHYVHRCSIILRL